MGCAANKTTEFLDEKELIRACIDRQDRAWETFLSRYSSLIYHVIWKTLRKEGHDLSNSSLEVEDVRAEVLHQVVTDNFRMLRSFGWRCKFSTWLSIVTYRTCLQAIHRNRHVAVSLDQQTGGASGDLPLKDIVADHRAQAVESLQSAEVRQRVQEALATLAPRDQLVLKFFYFEGKKYAEIARILGISGSLVGTAIFRAKLRLAEKLQRQFFSDLV